MHVCLFVCLYVCLFVFVLVCMYVCTYLEEAEAAAAGFPLAKQFGPNPKGTVNGYGQASSSSFFLSGSFLSFGAHSCISIL